MRSSFSAVLNSENPDKPNMELDRVELDLEEMCAPYGGRKDGCAVTEFPYANSDGTFSEVTP